MCFKIRASIASRIKRQTHLDPTSLPGVDGGFAFRTKKVRFALYKFKAEDFSISFDKLMRSQNFVLRNSLDLHTLIASEVPGSNSNRYSVSGSSFHSFFTTSLDSDVIVNDQYGQNATTCRIKMSGTRGIKGAA